MLHLERLTDAEPRGPQNHYETLSRVTIMYAQSFPERQPHLQKDRCAKIIATVVLTAIYVVSLRVMIANTTFAD